MSIFELSRKNDSSCFARSGTDERGLVSFMVTLIMMLVISLIVIGFTQTANRNRRIALDRQLSAQAFYAAESGVNDVVKKIQDRLDAGNSINGQDVCSSNNPNQYRATDLDAAGDVGYTCVLVDTTVPDVKTTASTDSSSIVHINLATSSGGNLPGNSADVTFKWGMAEGASRDLSNCSSTLGRFDTNGGSNSCGYGVLRIDLMQMANFNNADDLASNTNTIFMQPVNGVSTDAAISDFSSSDKARLIAASCDEAQGTCTGTVRLSGNAAGSTPGGRFNYYARISSLYQPSPSVVIDGSSLGGGDAWFIGAQAQVDVTGRARDVLRRVQVRVPLQRGNTSGLPLGAIVSVADICKKFTIYTGGYTDNCIPGVPGGGGGGGGGPDVGIGTCGSDPTQQGCPDYGDPNTDPPGPRYDAYLQNRSNNNPADIASCTWTASDGSLNRTDKCNYLDGFEHTFTDSGGVCYGVTVTLRVTLNNGRSDTKSATFYNPWGTQYDCYGSTNTNP